MAPHLPSVLSVPSVPSSCGTHIITPPGKSPARPHQPHWPYLTSSLHFFLAFSPRGSNERVDHANNITLFANRQRLPPSAPLRLVAHCYDLGRFRTIGAQLLPKWKPGKLCLPLKKARHASASLPLATSSTATAVSPKTFTATASSLHSQSNHKILVITHHKNAFIIIIWHHRKISFPHWFAQLDCAPFNPFRPILLRHTFNHTRPRLFDSGR